MITLTASRSGAAPPRRWPPPSRPGRCGRTGRRSSRRRRCPDTRAGLWCLTSLAGVRSELPSTNTSGMPHCAVIARSRLVLLVPAALPGGCRGRPRGPGPGSAPGRRRWPGRGPGHSIGSHGCHGWRLWDGVPGTYRAGREAHCAQADERGVASLFRRDAGHASYRLAAHQAEHAQARTVWVREVYRLRTSVLRGLAGEWSGPVRAVVLPFCGLKPT